MATEGLCFRDQVPKCKQDEAATEGLLYVFETDQCHGDLLFFQSFRDQVPKCTAEASTDEVAVDGIPMGRRPAANDGFG